jgi:FAD/FMN-containing dehydrogenase
MTMPDRIAVRDLRGSLSGAVAEPSEPLYAATVQIDNGRIALRPELVVLADSPLDVATTLAFARKAGLPLTVRGGGHSAAGYCLNEGGIVLDLRWMNAVHVDVDAQTMRVQMGATWESVYKRLLKQTSLVPVGGGCLPVGLPGFVLGGGFSFASRSFGLSVDNLLELTIVKADGETHVVSEASQGEEAELFWACRGGGGGNFGVAVEMVLRLHEPNSAQMLVARPRWPVEAAGEVFGFYNDWIESVPPELAVYGFWGPEENPLVAGKSLKSIGFTIVYNGEFAEGISLIEPLLELGPRDAPIDRYPLPQIEELIGGSTVVGDRSAYMWSGVMPPKGMTADVVSLFSENFASAPSRASFMVWTHLGGKVEEVAADATAFPHRTARFVPELKTIWTDRADTRVNVEWARAFFGELEPHLTGAYVNYIDPLLADWPRMYYGDNYPRLLRAKEHWDPDGVFDFQQGVGSGFEPSQEKPLDLSPLNRTFVPKET